MREGKTFLCDLFNPTLKKYFFLTGKPIIPVFNPFLIKKTKQMKVKGAGAGITRFYVQVRIKVL
jgi:hypothetical protein